MSDCGPATVWNRSRTRKRGLVAGGTLANPYHLLYRKDPTPGAATARQFGEFLRSQRGQQLTGQFGRGHYGDPLYIDAAGSAAPR